MYLLSLWSSQKIKPKYAEDEVYTIILAKLCESARIIINYLEEIHYNGINDEYYEVLAEGDCDRIGAALFNLAEMIAGYETEQALLK